LAVTFLSLFLENMASAKGDQFVAEAQKALNRTLIFGFGRAQKYEDAAEFFAKAGNAYKLANLWQSSGDSFAQAAEAWLQGGDNQTEAINCLIESGNAYKKINPVDAIRAYERAIGMYNEKGRFGMSARYYKEIAELLESDHNTDAASGYYEKAAEMFEHDNKKSNSNTCLLKVAAFSSEKGDLLKAMGIFESIGKESLSSRLGAYSAKGYFFQSLLCCLALGDNVQVNKKIEEYKNTDYSFGASRECEFIVKLVKVS
jgi:alpha-soluble NSF attachment protein